MPYRRSSSWFALLFVTVLLLVGGIQSVQKQLAERHTIPDGDLPPVLIVLPSLMLDLTPQAVAGVMFPHLRLMSDASH